MGLLHDGKKTNEKQQNYDVFDSQNNFLVVKLKVRKEIIPFYMKHVMTRT